MFIINVADSLMDLVVDVIIINEATKNQKEGTEKLRSMCQISTSAGFIVGSLIAGYVNQSGHSRWIFIIYTPLPIMVFISAMFLNKKLDTIGAEDMKSFWFNLKKIGKDLLKTRHFPEIFQVIVLLVLMDVLEPNYPDFMLYYNQNVRGITKVQDGYLQIV